MFCPQCGKQIPDESKFCFKCGRSLPPEAVPQATAVPGFVVSREDLEARYASLPDDELIALRRSDLTDVAQSCLDQELNRRGIRATSDATQAPLTFFPVATHKFITLAVCSFGIYELYWCYQNWKCIKSTTGEDLSPFWRAFFAPVWGFSLFRRVQERAVSANVSVAWHPEALGALYLLMSVLWRLPDPWWLISLATFVPVLPVQHAAQRINAACLATSDRNDSYSAANVVLIVLGGLTVVLGVVGSFLPK